jgi:ubiquinone/menaquinone biosynthesis C-methylase UbiE
MTAQERCQPAGVAQVWDRVSAGYDAADYWARPENAANLRVLLEHAGEPAGLRMIEVGCGSGLLSLALARRGAQCTLLDVSPVALDGAARRFAEAGLPVPACRCEDALAGAAPSAAFDVAWNSGVIEHFYDAGKERLLREMLRMVRPGGRVVVMAPNRWCWPFQAARLWMQWRGTWPYGFEDDLGPRRLRRLWGRLGAGPCTAYAFNPVLGWRWLPRMGGLCRRLGLETPEHHARRCRGGFVSVLAGTRPP